MSGRERFVGVVFDLGGTLGRDSGPGDRMGMRLRSLQLFLKARGASSDVAVLAELRALLDESSAAKDVSIACVKEQLASEMLKQVLSNHGENVDDQFITLALQAFYEPEIAGWKAFPGAREALMQLKSDGYKLAILSNTPDTAKQVAAFHHIGLAEFFDPVVMSSDIGYRKPDVRSFDPILAAWGAEPHQIVMVGDMLNRDICGAYRGGIASILVVLDGQKSNENDAFSKWIHPDEKVTDLLDILGAVRRLELKRTAPKKPVRIAAIVSNLKRSKLAIISGVDDPFLLEHRRDVQFQWFSFADITRLEQTHGEFDIVFCQSNQLIAAANVDQSARDQISSLRSYLKNNPSCTILDSLDDVAVVTNRWAMHTKLASAFAESMSESPLGMKIGVPNACRLFSYANDEASFVLQHANLRFPLIVKPMDACSPEQDAGSTHHQLTLLVSEVAERSWISSSRATEATWIIEEAHKHCGTVYKCYAIGDFVYYFPATSLPDSSLEDTIREPMQFTSKYIVNMVTKSEVLQPILAKPTVDFIAERIRSSFRIHVFGFDVIVASNTGIALVIDINYFPSYRRLPDLMDRIATLIVNRTAAARSDQINANK